MVLCRDMWAEHTSGDEVRPLVRAAHVAGGQFGLITRAQARDCGMSDTSITYHARRSWTSIEAGVFMLPGFAPSWEQKIMALCLREAVASHSTAGVLLGLDGCEREPIHVLARTKLSCGYATVHRTGSLPACDLGNSGPIRITNASRTLVDLGAVCDEETVEFALECALRRGMTSIPRLRWRLDQVGGRGRRGSAVLRRLLDLRDPDTRPAQSVLEVKFLRRLRGRRLPSPVRQLEVHTGRQRRYLDFAWPHARLDVEVGGRRSHSGPAAEQRDSRRHNELTALGWTVLYFTWDDVDHRIDYVISSIEKELRPQLV